MRAVEEVPPSKIRPLPTTNLHHKVKPPLLPQQRVLHLATIKADTTHCVEQLEGQPLLLNGSQERPRADAVVQVAVKVLAHEVRRFVGVHPALKGPHMGEGDVGQLLADLREASLICLVSGKITGSEGCSEMKDGPCQSFL